MILLCALMVGLAFSPSATEKLADILYGENRGDGIVDVIDKPDLRPDGSQEQEPGEISKL